MSSSKPVFRLEHRNVGFTTNDAYIVVLNCFGSISSSTGGPDLLNGTIRNLEAQGRKNIILNLAETDFIDSAGLGEIVSGFSFLQSEGGTLTLLSPQKRVMDMLELCKISSIIKVFLDEQEAIANFQ